MFGKPGSMMSIASAFSAISAAISATKPTKLKGAWRGETPSDGVRASGMAPRIRPGAGAVQAGLRRRANAPQGRRLSP
jgi:hypothetical protein